MPTIEGFEFFPLHYDDDGKPTNGGEGVALTQQATNGSVTDVILIAHGFRNSEGDATTLYTNFLKNFRLHLSRPEFAAIATRTYAVGGVLWPSKSFKEAAEFEGSAQGIDDGTADRRAAEEALRDARDTIACNEQRPKLDKAIALLDRIEGDPAAQNELVSLVLSLTDDLESDPSEGLEEIRAQDGERVLEVLQAPVILPTVPDDDFDGGSSGFAPFIPIAGDGQSQSFRSFVGSIFGAVGTLLNLTTWYVMKNRAGIVGANGVADIVRQLENASPVLRVHLVGHSLGGRLMASCAKALAKAPIVHPDSLTLLEAAFSHYGFSAAGGDHPEGFFRDVVANRVVKGPIVATFSAKDTVVGLAYAIASRLANDNTQAIGDKDDKFGGIGRNGAQQCDVAVADTLHQPGVAYTFPPGRIVSLDGSAGLITSHGDVTNQHVTYAFASVLKET